MVTYFCNTCGQYLKKKQGETHGYCSTHLVCSICKTELNGFAQIKGHTICHPGRSKKISKLEKRKTKVLDFSKFEWKGFKNTLRKIVRESKDQKIEKNLLKKSFEVLFKKFGHKHLNYKFVFEKKLGKAKNLKKIDNYVVYKSVC